LRLACSKLKAGACAFAVAVAVASPPALADAASGGGLSSSPGPISVPSETPPTPCSPESGGMANSTESCAPVQKARLIDGEAIAPADAPPAVKAVIAAADAIRTTPYIWGGGHLSWLSRGYDCSGAVSFALHGGDFLSSPLVSGQMMHWGRPGKGRWITVYANPVHTYAVIAGRRWDTVGDPRGVTGPRWHPSMAGETTAGFVARHPAGY
jgi:cell wall-associated NlpC family hydrolase